MMVTEHWIDQIARTLGVTPEAVREANMYDENDVTHYGQVLDGCQVRPCWYYVSFPLSDSTVRLLSRCLGLGNSCAGACKGDQ